MNIGDKLTYSRSWQRIYFFKEGVFVQLYGVSLYLAVTHLNLSAKVLHYRHKARDYQTILRAGIPEKSLTSLVNGELIKCDYGYQLIVNQPQNLAGY